MTSRTGTSWLLSGCLAVGLLAAWPAAPARACGGLFCSAAMPVNQAAERIIFSYDKPNKKVTAVVEILYQGPSEKFAWVLPVPGIPQVGVSTSAVLDRLQAVTNPTYTIQRTWGGQCGGGRGVDGATSAPSSPPATPGGPSAEAAVNVLAAGSVGPYVYEVIMVNPANADPAMVAIEWLKANGYDVGALGPDVLRPYLRDNLNLLAFKLAKNKMAGSIRPVMLTYDSDHPMIPIRPTAVAANDDMGILVWVLGSGRAVPTNYKSLELNEAIIDWFNPSMVYNDVVVAAADEAGGQGFVTELAGPTATSNIADAIYQERFAVDQFRRQADGQTPAALIVSAIQTFASSAGQGFGGPFGSRPSGGRVALDGVADVLSKHLKLMEAGVTVDQFMASPRCYLEMFRIPGQFYCDGKPAPAKTVDLTGFDRVAFLTDVEAMIVQPMEKTSQLFRDQRYMTRFYTTMSARDMTLDPDFDLNPSLPDVSNRHTMMLKYLDTCPGDVSGRWEATLQSGTVVKGRDITWPFSVKDQVMPVNRRVTQLGATGTGTVVKDNTTMIDSMASGMTGGVPNPTGGMPNPTGGGPSPVGGTGGLATGGSSGQSSGSGGGCSVGGDGAASGLGLLLLLGLGLLAGRRRAR
jgi:MYXO-CTERM domain-containing protein